MGIKKLIETTLEFYDQFFQEEKYPLSDSQPAQIDCRKVSCRFHDAGACHNVSPAITLGSDGKFTCWSFSVSCNKTVTEKE